MRLHNIIIILLILGVLFAPSISFSQTEDSSKVKMNRVSIQTGLFHYFFDNAPILNVNYLRPKNNSFDPFRGLLFNSTGIKYSHKINRKNSISIEVNSFRNTYSKHSIEFPKTDTYNSPKAKVYERRFVTLNVSYSRIKKFTNTVNFIYGGGVNYRHGTESIIVNKGYIGIHLEGSRKNDFGLNAFTGIDYTPIPWLTLYSKIDFLGLVYLHDKENIERLGNYSNMPDHYPSRFDLSLRFGIGVNF